MLGFITWQPSTHAQQTFNLEDGEWVALPTPDPSSPAGQLAFLQQQLAINLDNDPDSKSLKQIAEDTEGWIKRYPNHTLQPQAHLLLGDTRATLQDYYNALFDYEYVIRVFPGSDEFFTALEREFEIAKLYLGGMRRKMFGFRWLSARGEAIEILIRIQERAPGTPLAEQASLMLADQYFNTGEMRLAAEAYDLYVANYPRSAQVEYAMLREIRANLARFKGPEFDPTGLLEALQLLGDYETRFPAAAEQANTRALRLRIEDSLARKDFLTARWYERRGQNVSAVWLYERVVREYPTTSAAFDAVDKLRELNAFEEEF